MKKLSVKNNNSYSQSYKVCGNISEVVVSDGFSGLVIDGELIKGSCAKCVQQFCRQYQRSELYSEQFNAFPKNSSSRVCPVDAIKIGSDGIAQIDASTCVKCGLCLHRCPYSAIQLSVSKNTCAVNPQGLPLEACEQYDANDQIETIRTIQKTIGFKVIPTSFSEAYTTSIREAVYANRDVSEIIVRNTLTNLGCLCNVNAPGNNHIRIEFFAESEDDVIIGESEITNTDTLSVTRRILDDLAVLISRYGYSKEAILPLAVINGLPNKRTDYYEVVEDIDKVLGIKVATVTYHILFVLNLFNIHLDAERLSSFFITRANDNLLVPMKSLIKNIDVIDKNINTPHYTPVK